MQRDTAFINKLLRKKQQERSIQYHLENIKNVKPLTRLPQGLDVNINNRKMQYQNELRFTQIERQNRILLQKISSIMNKTKRSSITEHNSKSLNSTFRKKVHQDIQIQNAKLLKRLQDKKPNYDTQRLNRDWMKQKNVMKIMSNFPFMLADRPKMKRQNMSQMGNPKFGQQIQPIELVRMRVINGSSFLVTIQLSSKMLRISGDCKDRKQIKVIQIERNEAIQFIQEQCHGKLQEVFSHLRYDKQQGVLYLVGNQVELDKLLAEQRRIYGGETDKIIIQKSEHQQLDNLKLKFANKQKTSENPQNTQQQKRLMVQGQAKQEHPENVQQLKLDQNIQQQREYK